LPWRFDSKNKALKKKECPSCAMMIDHSDKVCPICGYDFPGFSPWIKWIAVFLLIINVSLIMFDLGDRAIEFTLRSFTIPGYFWSTLWDFPTLKEFIEYLDYLSCLLRIGVICGNIRNC